MRTRTFYLLVIVLNLVIVALIGLQPHYMLYHLSQSSPGVGEVGLFPMVFSNFTWIPSITLALFVVILFIKLARPQRVQYWIIVALTAVIHVSVSYSIFPGMYLLYGAKYVIESKQFSPTYTLVYESNANFNYSYSLQINNTSRKTYRDVDLYVRPSLTNLTSEFDHISLVAVESNRPTKIDIPPGQMIIEGNVMLSPQIFSQYGPEHIDGLRIGILNHYSLTNKYTWLASSLDWSRYFRSR